MSISCGGAYHFGEYGRYNEVPLTFFYLGGTYTQYETVQHEGTNIYISPRIGMDFYMLKRLYFSASLGLGVSMHHSYKNKVPEVDAERSYMPIIPSGQVSLVYTFFWKGQGDKK